jgi:hypothetical protein
MAWKRSDRTADAISRSYQKAGTRKQEHYHCHFSFKPSAFQDLQYLVGEWSGYAQQNDQPDHQLFILDKSREFAEMDGDEIRVELEKALRAFYAANDYDCPNLDYLARVAPPGHDGIRKPK